MIVMFGPFLQFVKEFELAPNVFTLFSNSKTNQLINLETWKKPVQSRL